MLGTGRHRTPQRRKFVALLVSVVVVGTTLVAAHLAGAAARLTLTVGTALESNEYLTSPDGRIILQMQADGNLVLRSASRAIWDSGTPGHPGAYLVLQADGNLVVRSATTAVLYNAATQGHPDAVLSVQNEGFAQLVSAGRAIWATTVASLGRGQVLVPGDALYSPSRTYSLVMQGDGNLVLNHNGIPRWSTNTPNTPGSWAAMQSDGNFVIYSTESRPLFNTETSGRPGAALTVQDDGNIVIRLGTQALWSLFTGSLATVAAVNNAAAYGASRGERVAVALFDRKTNRVYTAGDVDTPYASASVMKVFIATKLLVTGQSKDPTIADLMWRMIILSDDNAANRLYAVVGGAGVATWAAARYRLSGIQATPISNYWGLTRITARAMANYYSAAIADPVVGPWLLNAMANMHAPASDGWPQNFGIPSATNGWRVKQGWMCCLDSRSRLHSTGFVNNDRYTVALLTEGSTATYSAFGLQTVNGMAVRLMPGGVIPR